MPALDRFRGDFPRLPTGKLYKTPLRDRYWAGTRAGSSDEAEPETGAGASATSGFRRPSEKKRNAAANIGRTGRKVGEIGFGAGAIGGSWGEVEESDAVEALNAALDAGVDFIDTADVYGDGRSERIVASVLNGRPGAKVFVATKAGQRMPQQTVAGYTYANLTGWIDRSLRNLATETLDLVQLHCPPTELYGRPEAFDALDRIKAEGKIRDYGVSVSGSTRP